MTFARVRRDEAWVDAVPIAGSELAALDGNLTGAINGNDGSTHAPTAPIQVAGSGGMAAGLWVLSGGASVQLDELGSTPSRVVLADGDFPVLGPQHPGRARKLATQLAPGWSNGDFQDAGFAEFPGARGTFGPLAVHDQARVTDIVVTFQVVDFHAAVPDMPRFRLFSMDAGGRLTQLLANASVGGWLPYSPKPTDPTLWGPDGYTQDALKMHYFRGTAVDGAVIDAQRCSYWLEIIDESGPNAKSGYPAVAGGNFYMFATLSFVDILDLRPG
ncbi:hypothetical protein LZC95_19975 [Pendulispora brunnea]|uniref:Uncharacterized protein n=1 Tax=Pendulispora brunnea TaxID=2905690 RepID=A0ABZ2KKA0_9BACT